MFGIDNEADWPSQMLTHFDEVITREDKAILESTDPDALIDTRRRGVECSMDSNRPGMMIRKRLFELLRRHGKEEVHRGKRGVEGDACEPCGLRPVGLASRQPRYTFRLVSAFGPRACNAHGMARPA